MTTISNLLTYSILLILFAMLPLCCFAAEPLVSKSVSSIQGVENTKYFYYDSLNRLALLEEYDSNGQLTQQTVHSYEGLIDVDSTYIRGKFAYSMVTTYTDSSYQYIQTQCLRDGGGKVRNGSEYMYDQYHRVTQMVESENDEVCVITTYTYSPFRCTCIVDYAHYDDDVFKIKYHDRLCTQKKLERCLTSDDNLERKTRYDAHGRVTEYIETEKGKITQQIQHLYYETHEVIVNLEGDVIINYYR